jgi:hypothetical protein
MPDRANEDGALSRGPDTRDFDTCISCQTKQTPILSCPPCLLKRHASWDSFDMTLLEKSTVIQNLKAQHEGTESLAIKNTFIRRICTLVALKTTARLFKRNGACIPISKRLIVKTGPYVHLE